MGRTESASVIAEQRSLIEDLAHSNQEYIRNFENLRLGIGGDAIEDAIEDAETISKAGAVETELSTKTEPIPPVSVRKFDSMNFATLRTPPQDEENTRGLGFNEPTTATRLSSNGRSGVTKLLATPPNADINNLFINTSGQSNITMPSLQVQGKSRTEAPLGFDQEVLFKQLRYFSMLVQDLLEKVDEPKYKITFQSRLRMKGSIAGLHEEERRELEKMWGCTALQKAEQRLDSLVEEFGDLPSLRRSVPFVFSANDSSWFHSAATSHSEDSFAGNSEEWASPYLTNSMDSLPSEFIDCTEEVPIIGAKKRGRRRKRGAEAKGRAKNTTDSMGQSTDAPIVGYVEPHQQDSSREGGVDMPFQPSTSAASVVRLNFYPTSLETGLDVRTPNNNINVHFNQLIQSNRKATACHSTAISTIWTFSRGPSKKMIVILILVGSRWPRMTCIRRHFQSPNL